MFCFLFRQKARTNGRFPVCRRLVLVPMRIFSHRHKNLFSWAREFRLFVVPFSRPTGRTERRCPPLILPVAQNPLPLLLIYRATSRDSAGVDGTLTEPLPPSPWTKGVTFAKMGGSPFVRGGGQRQGTGRDSRILSASRGRFSRTGWPFRRNGIGVPAQRHHRFKAIEHPVRTCPTGETGVVDRDTPGF